MGSRIVPTVLIGLVLIVITAVIASNAYQVGVARGLADSGKAAQSEPGIVPPAYYGGPYPYYYHGPFGFGFFGFLFPLLFVFLIFGLLRFAFGTGRWRAHGGGPYGSWKMGIPPQFEEWHRRVHESRGDSGTKI